MAEEYHIKSRKDIKKATLKKIEEEYWRLRKNAKTEDNKAELGQIRVPTRGREEFISFLIKMHKMGIIINPEDINLIFDTLYMHPNLANNTIIRFLLSEAATRGGIKSSQRRALELSNILEGTIYRERLIEYSRWAKKVALIPKIQEMKKRGMSNTEVGNALNITSAEVLKILEMNTKNTSFDDVEKIII